jgi:hypothetical protein
VFENPWIDVTVEWSDHAIALRASAKVVTRPSEDHKGGDVDPDVEVFERWGYWGCRAVDGLGWAGKGECRLRGVAVSSPFRGGGRL